MSKCDHKEVYPDGTCAECNVLATMFPGLSEAHKMVPYPPEHWKAKQ